MRVLSAVLVLVAVIVVLALTLRGRESPGPDALVGGVRELETRTAEQDRGELSESAPGPELEPASQRTEAAPAVPDEAPPRASQEPGARVRVAGRVFHRGSDEPVSGGRIAFELAPGPVAPELSQQRGRTSPASIATKPIVKVLDDEGRFALRLDADAWVVRVRIEPPEPVRVDELESLRSHVQVAGFVRTAHELGRRVRELELPLRLEVDPGLSISGRVVDALDGEGIEDVWITTRALVGDAVATRSDAKGEFVLSGLDEEARRWLLGGPLDLVALHPLYVAHGESVELPADVTSVTGVEIALTAGITIEGVVVDAEGRGIAGVHLEARALAHRATSLGRSLAVLELAVSGTQGWFQFPAIPATRELELVLGGRHASMAEPLLVDGTRSHTDLVVELAPSRRYQVRALSPSGEEVDASKLVVLVKPDGAALQKVATPFDVARDRAFDLELYAAPPDPAQLAEHWRGRMRVLPADGGDEPRELEVRLERWASAQFPLEGPLHRSGFGALPHAQRVFDVLLLDASAGTALRAGTRVRVEAPGSSHSFALPADGRIRLELGLGARVLELSPAGYEPLRIEIEALAPGHEEITLPFEPRRRG